MRALKFRSIWLLVGFVVGLIIFFGSSKLINYTSTDEYCISCHIHPDADKSWTECSHYNNASGVRTHCIDCHLPPKGSFNHLWTKSRIGFNHLWKYYTKDSASFDWDSKKQLEHAVKIVYNESCVACHQNIFTKGISMDGLSAHLYYEENKEKLKLQCINCHLDVGHFNPNYKHEINTSLGIVYEDKSIFDSSTRVVEFKNYTEQIPGTNVSFNMLAIPGGNFKQGSPENEAYRNSNEDTLKEMIIESFFMAETEVTWNEYLAFYSETKSEGRIDPRIIKERNLNVNDLDGISGPTPPYGQPDQGWGYDNNPAITMSHYAAQMYCKWLSLKTGKKYRLPTESEWEYAARAGTETPYFFGGNPKKYTRERWWNKVFGVDTAIINSYVIYSENSGKRTKTAKAVGPNQYGLKNMLGNVLEYCSDKYNSKEFVVRGGWFASDAKDVRSASRGSTLTTEWLKTDPQSPKSIWWLSDCNWVGFRVICEIPKLHDNEKYNSDNRK